MTNRCGLPAVAQANAPAGTVRICAHSKPLRGCKSYPSSAGPANDSNWPATAEGGCRGTTRSRRSGGIYDSPFHDRHQSMAHDASTGRPAKPVGRNFPPGCQSTPFALVWSGLPLSAPLNRQCHIFVAALSSVLVTRGAGKVAYSTAGESFANLAGVPEPRKWEISTLPAKPSQPSHQANAV